jgi:DegV family protein with EDD domain
MLKIITDSTNNLPESLIKRYDIRVAPISIQFGEETFEEGINITRSLFYSKIDELGILPTSAQPTPAWFEKFYREFTDQGHSILVITVTGKHSGTYESAILAKSLVPEADVEVFDTLSLTLGTGWMVLEAARANEAGQDRASIISRLEEIRDRAHLCFTPATLKYLQMSGRVSTLSGAIGSLISLKPIIVLEDGVLAAKEKIRTRSKAVTRLIELTEEAVGTSDPVNVAVVHADAPEEGQALLDRVKAHFNCQEALMEDLVASLAVHGGPGILMIFAYRV